MSHPAVVDTRNMLDPSAARAAGLHYLGMGRSLMRVLVAGGAGFIGATLCARLLDRGDQIVCVDNLITGSADNVKPLLDRGGMAFVEAEHLCGPGSPRALRGCREPGVPGLACGLRASRPRDPGRRKPGSRQPAGAGPAGESACSCRRPPVRFTANPSCTRKRSPIGATSTRSGPGRCTTRPNASVRLSPWPSIERTGPRSASPASSTPMVPACAPMTGESSRIS